jgi:hypothetical protein
MVCKSHQKALMALTDHASFLTLGHQLPSPGFINQAVVEEFSLSE